MILEGGVLTHIPPFHNILKSGQDRASFYFDSRVPTPPNVQIKLLFVVNLLYDFKLSSVCLSITFRGRGFMTEKDFLKIHTLFAYIIGLSCSVGQSVALLVTFYIMPL